MGGYGREKAGEGRGCCSKVLGQYFYYYHQRLRCINAIGHVCMSVCLCLNSVRDLTLNRGFMRHISHLSLSHGAVCHLLLWIDFRSLLSFKRELLIMLVEIYLLGADVLCGLFTSTVSYTEPVYFCSYSYRPTVYVICQWPSGPLSQINCRGTASRTEISFAEKVPKLLQNSYISDIERVEKCSRAATSPRK